MIYKINLTVWKGMISFFTPVSDHVALPLVIAGFFMGMTLAFFRDISSMKAKEMLYPAGTELLMLAEYPFLKNLSSVHPRICLMLKTVSEVIAGSGEYSQAFRKASGMKEASAAKIASYLYRIPYGEMKKFLTVEPAMAYGKLCHVFLRTRYLLGYLDGKTGGFWMAAGILFFFFLLFRLIKRSVRPLETIAGFACILVLISVMFHGYNGMVLSYIFCFAGFYAKRRVSESFSSILVTDYLGKERIGYGNCNEV